TPVYNTDVDVLYECILSVRAQAYPYWQLILVDDGSSNSETHNLLKSGVCKDPRIKILFNEQTQGISKTSNLAIENSNGDYLIFLDHDDRLSLDALFLIAKEIKQHPEVDILYSDRDMISQDGKRYMHLFKPDWSPETLLAGNYIFHLMCYRRSLLNQLGGYRSEMDGSQDYDLILRATETQPKVQHIQKVLYHWRQYQGSVSLDSNAKDYAFKAGVAALNKTLQRRGILGKALEKGSLWRGNYQLDLDCPDLQEIEIVNIDFNLPDNAYSETINQSIQQSTTKKPFIALISQAYTPVKENAIGHLAAWLKMERVGLASGGIITSDNLIEYSGATYKQDGSLFIPYKGYSTKEAGYMAVTKLVRNISAPHPFCVLIRRKVWEELNGLNSHYNGFYALLDFALRALEIDWRCVSVPQAQFMSPQNNLLAHFPEHDKQLFFKHWQFWLEKGDPYYNRNLDRQDQDNQFHLTLQ
ncbi:MAG: glycosyltransferase, partial [Methylococcaceae bacterium]